MHRVDEPRRGATGRRRAAEGAGALAAIPAVVAAALHAVDFLERALAHVADPQIAVSGVEAPPPRIAKTPGVDLRAVVRGDVVIRVHIAPPANGLSGGIAYGVAPSTSSRSNEPSKSRVSCAVLNGSPPSPPSPRQTDIQKAVGAERDLAAVVIRERLVDANDVLASRRIEREPAVSARETRDHRHHRRAFGERQEYLAVGGPIADETPCRANRLRSSR